MQTKELDSAQMEKIRAWRFLTVSFFVKTAMDEDITLFQVHFKSPGHLALSKVNYSCSTNVKYSYKSFRTTSNSCRSVKKGRKPLNWIGVIQPRRDVASLGNLGKNINKSPHCFLFELIQLWNKHSTGLLQKYREFMKNPRGFGFYVGHVAEFCGQRILKIFPEKQFGWLAGRFRVNLQIISSS